MLQKYNDSLPHSMYAIYFVKLENRPCRDLMRAIMGYRKDRGVQFNGEAEAIDIGNIFSLICISLNLMYLYYVSCRGLEYKTSTTAALYLECSVVKCRM